MKQWSYSGESLHREKVFSDVLGGEGVLHTLGREKKGRGRDSWTFC